MFFIFLIFLSLSCYSGAGMAATHTLKTTKTTRTTAKKHAVHARGVVLRPATVTRTHSVPKRRTKLLNNYRRWEGTRYRLGGTTHRAVDCSALTRHLYRETFQMGLPRTTGGQLSRGKRVTRAKLRVGDLVFFHTGRHQKHVGVYVGQQRFIHASRKKGVTISSLDDAYWAHHYLTARRVLKDTSPVSLKTQTDLSRGLASTGG